MWPFQCIRQRDTWATARDYYWLCWIVVAAVATAIVVVSNLSFCPLNVLVLSYIHIRGLSLCIFLSFAFILLQTTHALRSALRSTHKHAALSQYYYYCWFGCRFDFKINTKSHTDFFFFSLLCGWTFACRSYWISFCFLLLISVEYNTNSILFIVSASILLFFCYCVTLATVIQSTYIVRHTRAK